MPFRPAVSFKFPFHLHDDISAIAYCWHMIFIDTIPHSCIDGLVSNLRKQLSSLTDEVNKMLDHRILSIDSKVLCEQVGATGSVTNGTVLVRLVLNWKNDTIIDGINYPSRTGVYRYNFNVWTRPYQGKDRGEGSRTILKSVNSF